MKNWKTTVTALIGAAVVLLNKYLIPAFGVEPLPSDVIIIVVISALSLVTKDYDTTGVGLNAEKPK